MQAIHAAVNYVRGEPRYQVSEGRKEELAQTHRWTRQKECSAADTRVYLTFMDRVFTREVSQGNLGADQIDAAARTFSVNLVQATVTYKVATNPSGVPQPNTLETRTVDLRTITDQPTIQAIDALYEQGRLAFANPALKVNRENVVQRAAAKGNPQGEKSLQRADSGTLAALPKTKEDVEKTIGQLHLHLAPNEKRKAVTRQCYVDYLQNKFGKKVTEKALQGQHQFLTHTLPLVTAEKQRVQTHAQQQLQAQEDRCNPLREQIERQKQTITTKQEQIAALKQSIARINRAHATPEEQAQIRAAEEEIGRKKAEIGTHQTDMAANEAQLKPMEQEAAVLRRVYEQAQKEAGECATMAQVIQGARQLPAQLQQIDRAIATFQQVSTEAQQEIQTKETQIGEHQTELNTRGTALRDKIAQIATARQRQAPDIAALEGEKQAIEQDIATITQAITKLQADKDALVAKEPKLQSKIEVLTACRDALATLDQDKVKKAIDRITAFNKERGAALEQQREHHTAWQAKCQERVRVLREERDHVDTTPERRAEIVQALQTFTEEMQSEQASLEQEEQEYRLGVSLRLALIGNSVEHLVPKIELFERWFTALRAVSHEQRMQYDSSKKEVHFLQNLYKRLTGVDEYALAVGLTMSPSYRSTENDTQAEKRIVERVAQDIQAADQAKLDKEKSFGDKLKFWQTSKRSKSFDLIENGKIVTYAQVQSKNLSQEDTAEFLRQLKYLRDTVGLLYQDRASYAEYCRKEQIASRQESVEDIFIREAVLFEHVRGRGQSYNAEQLKASSLFVTDPNHAPRETLIAELQDDLDTIARTANQAIGTVSELECEANVLPEAEQIVRNAAKVKELRASKVDLTLAPILSLRQRVSGVITGPRVRAAVPVVGAVVAAGAWALEQVGVVPLGAAAVAREIAGVGTSVMQVSQTLSNNRSFVGAGLAVCGLALVESYALGDAAPVYELMVTNTALFAASLSVVYRIYQACQARFVGPAVPELEIGDAREREVVVREQRAHTVRQVGFAGVSMAMFAALYYALTLATGAPEQQEECDNSTMAMVAVGVSQAAAWAWDHRVAAGMLGMVGQGVTSPQARLFSRGVEALGRTRGARLAAARIPGAARAGRGVAATVRKVETLAHGAFGVVKDVAAAAGVEALLTKGTGLATGLWNRAFGPAGAFSAAAAPAGVFNDAGPGRPSAFQVVDVCPLNAAASAIPRFEEVS